jgi:hypothetical protein
MAYNTYFLPQVTYSLVTTNLTKARCLKQQSKVLSTFLPMMGYDTHLPRAVLMADQSFGASGEFLTISRTVQYCTISLNHGYSILLFLLMTVQNNNQ